MLSGPILKDERKRRNMSQRELAESLELSPAYINLIENGHRTLTPKLRARVCMLFDIDETRLAGKANQADLHRLQQSPYFSEQSIDDLERLVVEMPSFVKNVLSLEDEFAKSNLALKRLSDRISNDQKLSNDMHDLLSIATSIRSTSSILNTQGDLGPEQGARFREMLHQDARQLSETLRGLAKYLDQDHHAQSQSHFEQIRLIQYLEDRQYYLEAFESGAVTEDNLYEWIAQEFDEDFSRHGQIQRLFALFLQDTQLLPSEDFLKFATRENWDVLELVSCLGHPADRVLRRLAQLSRFGQFQNIALYLQDQTGEFLLESMALSGHRPSHLDCPFWPIFDSERERGRVFTRSLSLGEEYPFQAYAASGLGSRFADVGGQWIYKSMIVLRPSVMEKGRGMNSAAQMVGFSCNDCRVLDCSARRNRSQSVLQTPKSSLKTEGAKA